MKIWCVVDRASSSVVSAWTGEEAEAFAVADAAERDVETPAHPIIMNGKPLLVTSHPIHTIQRQDSYLMSNGQVFHYSVPIVFSPRFVAYSIDARSPNL